MFPILIFAGLAGLVAWAVRPKKTGFGVSPSVTGSTATEGRPKALPPYSDAAEPAGLMGPPFLPEEERLLTLLVLWARDKKNPLGKKRFMTPGLAAEIIKIASRLGLQGTARAVLKDGPIPADEKMPGRGMTVRAAVVAYGSKK